MSMLGKHFSEESKKKMSIVAKGRHPSEETRKKMSDCQKGRHHSEETKRKISEANKGQLVSKETRKKISMAETGKVVSEETRQRISESLKGLTEEKSRHWKGGLTRYYHNKAKTLFGTPCCENCGISLEEYASTHKKESVRHALCPKDYRILEQWNWGCLCSGCHC